MLAAAGGQSSVDLLKDGEDLKTKADKAKGMKRKGGKKGGDVTGGFCYRWIHLPSATRVRADSLRCNATDHSLSFCPEPVDPADPTPYATCFICLGTGHLSSLCPANPGRGIYVNGGSCKLCGSTAHRAKDCELNVRPVEEETELPEKRRREVVLGNGEGAGTDEDDFMVTSREQAKKGRVEKEGKRRRKKHPPAKNGERPAMTARARPEEDGDEGDSGRAGEVVVPVAAIAPATAPGKAKAKTKVVKF